MTRENLIVNPSFTTNTTGWSGTGGATISRIATDYVFGAACLEVAKDAQASSGAVTSSRISVTQNLSYAASAYVKVPNDQGATLRIEIRWYTALTGGSLISTSAGTTATVLVGADWIRLAKIATAPSTAVAAEIRVVQPFPGSSNEHFLLDGVLFEQSSSVGLYIDEPTAAEKRKATRTGLTPLPVPEITGMKLQADVQLGALILNTIDEDGVVWVVRDIKGWWEHPDPEVPDIPRGWGDGSYDVRGRWQARQLTLDGSFLPPDPSMISSAREKLIEASSLVYTNAWLYVNEEPTKATKVRLSGKPNIETVTPRGRTDFSIGLRAADPVKYEWNWEDVDGYTKVTIPAKNTATSETGTRTVTNSGNTPVSVILEITGPLTGPGEIYNAETNELITTVQALRPELTRGVTTKALTSNVATLTTNVAHQFAVGDSVTVSISDATFDGTHTALTIPSNTTFTYGLVAANVASTGASGTASILPDVLEIDTYNKEVAFNGSTDATRSMVDTLVDWIVLAPGDNEITFEDTGQANGTASMVVYYRSGWIG